MDSNVSMTGSVRLVPVRNPNQEVQSSTLSKGLKITLATAMAFFALATTALILHLTLGKEISQWFKQTYDQVSQFTQRTVAQASTLAHKAVTWIKDGSLFNVPNWIWAAIGGAGLMTAAGVGVAIGIVVKRKQAQRSEEIARVERFESTWIEDDDAASIEDVPAFLGVGVDDDNLSDEEVAEFEKFVGSWKWSDTELTQARSKMEAPPSKTIVSEKRIEELSSNEEISRNKSENADNNNTKATVKPRETEKKVVKPLQAPKLEKKFSIWQLFGRTAV